MQNRFVNSPQRIVLSSSLSILGGPISLGFSGSSVGMDFAPSVGMATATEFSYRSRKPDVGVLHRVVRKHLETFLHEFAARGGGAPLPAFLERELREFLTCGFLARGFARFRCDGCAAEHLVAFSCKGRAVCPSCTGRRMNERSADLVDRVLGGLPMRQYVLTVPHRLRFWMIFDHRLCRSVLAVLHRALLGMQRRRAKHLGLLDPKCGAVTAIQRCGSALNVNVHFHTLMPDGVFVEAGDAGGEEGAFRRLPPPSDDEVQRLLLTIRRRVLRLLRRRGLFDEDGAEMPGDKAAACLSGFAEAALRGRVATGRRAGSRLRRIGGDPDAAWLPASGRRHAHVEGFDLHAAIGVKAQNRKGLERLARYILRPPVAQGRLALRDDDNIVLKLPRSWADGTTHIVFEPSEFLERLVTLTPRPRINLIIYSGVFAGHARGRSAAVARALQTAQTATAPASLPGEAQPARPEQRHYRWADLMRRAFAVDVLACRRCDARLRLIATIESPEAIRRILTHLGLPTILPRPDPARAPPGHTSDFFEDFSA